MKKVRIDWIDSASPRGWTHDNEIDVKPLKIRTRGYLIRETKKAVVVACSVDECGTSHAPMTIPKCSITKMRKGK